MDDLILGPKLPKGASVLSAFCDPFARKLEMTVRGLDPARPKAITRIALEWQ